MVIAGGEARPRRRCGRRSRRVRWESSAAVVDERVESAQRPSKRARASARALFRSKNRRPSFPFDMARFSPGNHDADRLLPIPSRQMQHAMGLHLITAARFLSPVPIHSHQCSAVLAADARRGGESEICLRLMLN